MEKRLLSTSEDTFPKLLRRNCDNWGSEVSMRRKEFAVWQEYSWQDVYQKVKWLCLGLVSLGLNTSDKVSVLGDNDPEWFWAELATQSAGGIIHGLFVDVLPSEVEYFLNHAESKFVFASDQEQVDKVLEVAHKVPALQKVIYWDPKGLWNYDNSRLLFIDALEEMGKTYEREHPQLFEEMIEQGKGNDYAFLAYTSGTKTTGKGVMLSFRNILENFSGYGFVLRFRKNDDYLSYMPPGHIGEQGCALPAWLWKGVVLNFSEEADTMREDMRQIGPTSIALSPRFWEDMASEVQAKIQDTSTIRQFVYNLFTPVRYKTLALISGAERTSFIYMYRLLSTIGDWLVFRPIRDSLGLMKLDWAFTGGAALGERTFRFVHALGVRLVQGYGLTETSGWNVFHRLDNLQPHTVGSPHDQVEVRISQSGEICLRGPVVSNGYHKDTEASNRAFREGWFLTGDAGYFNEDCHLVVIDRISDLRYLSTGEQFSPAFIENNLKFSPYIKDAILVIDSEGRDILASLITMDFGIVSRWAERHGIPFTTMIDLSQKSQVLKLIKHEIGEVNKLLPAKVNIQRFVVLPKELDPDEAELTRTRKLRREFLGKEFGEIISAVFSGANKVESEIPIAYRDGRRGFVKALLQIESITD